MATLHIDRLPRNATPGEVVRFACKYGKVEGKSLGRVAFLGSSAVLTVADGNAAKLVAALDGATFRDYPVRVRLTSSVPRGDSTGHFEKFVKLLSLEADAERKEMKRRAALGEAPDGTTITKLLIRGEEIGLGGRFLVTLTRGKAAALLPPNRLQPGAPVVLTQTGIPRPASFRGVVSDRSARSVTVALDDSEEDRPDDATWRLDLSPDEVSRQRQLAALHRAAASHGDRLADVRDVLLGTRPAKLDPRPESEFRAPSTLNESQESAVRFALASHDVAVIHGPPGTGKTTTLVELIRRAVAGGARVLASAPSNAAVDNLLEKLLGVGLEPVRVGHPARVAEALRDRALDSLVMKHPEARQARKYRKEAQALLKQANKWTKEKPQPGERQALRREAAELLGVARRTEQTAVERILADARVICGTLTGTDSGTLGQTRFDLLVIDEACQSPEPACWIPIVRADKVVLAGDPCQLPPTVISQEATEGGLAVSLMERVMATCGPGISRLLTVQYRMHADIADFSSHEFYGGELVPHASVAGHLLRDLDGVADLPLTATPAQFLDTAGAGYDEAREADTASRFNAGEAEVVVKCVRRLLAAGLPAADIAVITPYNGQARLIREKLEDTEVEVDSVDGFQGREKEAVVISMVRSNVEGGIGFLADVRRTNVALTRARRKLVVVGDSATLGGHDFYRRMLDYFDAIGGYGSVWDEMGDAG